VSKFSGLLFVLDPDMGYNGIEHGVPGNVRQFSYTFEARNKHEAQYICEQCNLVYGGKIIETQ